MCIAFPSGFFILAIDIMNRCGLGSKAHCDCPPRRQTDGCSFYNWNHFNACMSVEKWTTLLMKVRECMHSKVLQEAYIGPSFTVKNSA